MLINLAPVEFNNKELLQEVVNFLRRQNLNIKIIDLPVDINQSYQEDRNQYYSTQILSDTTNLTRNIDGKILILTDVDLFVPVLTFIYGEAQLNGKHSIVSVCRLHEEFYTGISNFPLLLKRTIKETLHELGHNFGMKHCKDWGCVMHSSTSIEEVDIKGDNFCRECFMVIKNNNGGRYGIS
jgi:archaemetzincin